MHGTLPVTTARVMRLLAKRRQLDGRAALMTIAASYVVKAAASAPGRPPHQRWLVVTSQAENTRAGRVAGTGRPAGSADARACPAP
jgi:hypothetical protein